MCITAASFTRLCTLEYEIARWKWLKNNILFKINLVMTYKLTRIRIIFGRILRLTKMGKCWIRYHLAFLLRSVFCFPDGAFVSSHTSVKWYWNQISIVRYVMHVVVYTYIYCDRQCQEIWYCYFLLISSTQNALVLNPLYVSIWISISFLQFGEYT